MSLLLFTSKLTQKQKQQIYLHFFGNHIFTKTDKAKFPNSFPTRVQIIDLGKSVFLSVQDEALVDDKWHKVSFWPSFPPIRLSTSLGTQVAPQATQLVSFFANIAN